MIVLIQLDGVDVKCLVPHLVPDSDLGKRAVVVLSNVKAKHVTAPKVNPWSYCKLLKSLAYPL